MGSYENIQPSGGSTGAPINLIRRLTLIKRFLDLNGKSILDSGCGAGNYVRKFLEYSDDVCGVEYEQKKVDEYRQKFPSGNHVKQGDIEGLSFDEARFDLVLLNEVLEHVPNDVQAVKESVRVLKPGGILAVFSPNRLYPSEPHGTQLKNTNVEVPLFVPFIPYIPLGLGKYILKYRARNYFPWELKKIIEMNDVEVLEHTAIWQTFENISGRAPAWMRAVRRVLRFISFALEKIPLIRFLGLSQVVIARKKSSINEVRD